MSKTLDELIEFYREQCRSEKKRFPLSDDGGIEHFAEKVEKYQRVTETTIFDDIDTKP